MKKINKKSAEATKAEATSVNTSVESIDTNSLIIAEAPKAEDNNSTIISEPTAATVEAPKAKKVLDVDSFNVSKAIILAYRTAEQANADAAQRGFPRREDEKDLGQVRLAVFKPHVSVWVDVTDRRGGLYRGSLIWVSYMLNTDGSIAKNTVQLHRKGEPTEADLMVSPVDPDPVKTAQKKAEKAAKASK